MASLRILIVVFAAAGLLGTGFSLASASGTAARGAGATLPQPVYARWAELYSAETGNDVTYDGVGSGAGVEAIRGSTVAFGATDAPLADAALRSDALIQFPMLIGGVVPVVNLPGVGPGDLVLDGTSLADLFEGRIAFWDDAGLARLNRHLPLPHLAVVPVHRSDSSGTTAVFAAYLAAAAGRSGAWLSKDPPELRPIGIGTAGSGGMGQKVAATPGAIGYIGFDIAQTQRLSYADLINPAGRVVQPTLASIAAAAADADWSGSMMPSLLVRPGGASWPIVSATYVVVHMMNRDAVPVGKAIGLFAWALAAGGPAAEDLGFVPLPDRVAAMVRAVLGRVYDGAGNPLLNVGR